MVTSSASIGGAKGAPISIMAHGGESDGISVAVERFRAGDEAVAVGHLIVWRARNEKTKKGDGSDLSALMGMK